MRSFLKIRLKPAFHALSRVTHPFLIHKGRLLKVLFGLGGALAALWIFLWISMGPFREFQHNFFQFAGYPFSNRNYLVLFLDENEISEGGGSIYAYGLFKYRFGIYAGFSVGGSATSPSVDFNAVALDPDFTVSAAAFSQAYDGGATKIDGVIAINTRMVQDWLALAGPLMIDDKKYESDTFYSLLIDTLPHQERSNFVRALYWQTLVQPWKWSAWSALAYRHLSEKNVLMSFSNDRLKNMAEEQRWDSVFPTSASEWPFDFLAVTERNTAKNKSNRYIKRTINYTVNITQDSATGEYRAAASLDVRHFHYGSENPPLSTLYTANTQVFAPIMSQIGTRTADSERTDRGWHVFEKSFQFEPGKGYRLQYQYELPSDVFAFAGAKTGAKTYRLRLWKPAGMNEDYYSVLVTAPAHVLLSAANVAENAPVMTVRENTALWNGTLDRDAVFNVTLEEVSRAPKLVWSEMHGDSAGQSRIILHFNRPLSAAALDGLNYTVKDLNRKHGKTDEVLISKVTTDADDRVVVLQLQGISQQPGEAYAVTVRNLADKAGNFIEPNPIETEVTQSSW